MIFVKNQLKNKVFPSKWGQKMGFLKIWTQGLSCGANTYSWSEFQKNRAKNGIFPILAPFAWFFRQNGVKKWDFRKFEPRAFEVGRIPTPGANFVKIGPKTPKPLLELSPDFRSGVPFD